MMWAKVTDGKVQKTKERPDWRDDNGQSVSDEFLNEKNWFLVEERPPDFDRLTEFLSVRPRDEWKIIGDRVVVTYRVQAKSLAQVKKQVIEKAKRSRDEVFSQGVWVQLRGINYRLRADDASRAALDQAALDSDRRNNWSEDWRAQEAEDGNGKPADPWITDVTAEELEKMRAATAALKSLTWKHLHTIENQINAANSVAELAAIEVESSWPTEVAVDGGR